ncbi:zinc metallopeptidase [Bacillus sp. RG28]|uniref:Zinc metallopeptidase n=1 Tax=Gottfriedia endophytica TaxID=2820819 RepID=A0A940NUB3_9BACI|nr:zinc metallopeptidase [Gottfriedia endophytica]MBP0726911.1 zinc metallopeptidase [Gottfriedia endophytica]
MFFHPMDILIFIAFGLSLWAQSKVSNNFSKWSQVPATFGYTGADVARKILNDRGLFHVPVEVIPGRLSDHYDPTSKVVRLSEDVYYGTSIASVSVAAHEVGHAIQHEESYGFLTLRHQIFPLLNITSGIAPLLLLAGFIFHATSLIGLGILFFSVVVAFQVITLPVEFNASSRAKKIMLADGIISKSDAEGVNKVLGAAALTYLAAALISVLELVKYILIFRQNEED